MITFDNIVNASPADAQRFWGMMAGDREDKGIYMPEVSSFLPAKFKRDYHLAMDAQPTLTTTPSSAVPNWLTTYLDPKVIQVLFAPNKAAVIFDEVRKGSWLDETAMFTLV
jgi:hypothetical protein